MKLLAFKDQLDIILDKVWEVLVSKSAILIYAIIVLVLLFLLVVKIIVSEQRRVDEINHRKQLKQDIVNRETLSTIEQAIDKKMDKMGAGIVIAGSTPTSVTKKSKKEKKNDGESRFYMLTGIDKAYEEYEAPEYDNEITLNQNEVIVIIESLRFILKPSS